MQKNKKLYIYNGPYYKFGTYIDKIYVETYAVSKAKAISNIKFKIKEKLGLLPNANISILSEQIEEVN